MKKTQAATKAFGHFRQGRVAMPLAVAFAALFMASAPMARADTAGPIKHAPADGKLKLYGAGGPHSALIKVADAWKAKTGKKVEFIYGPESKWAKQAQADADVLWGTAEQAITAYLENFKSFSSKDVKPLYLRPAVIAVKKGNPKGIKGFDDLLKDGMRIVVTEGAGVYNTSGTGVWEDVAGRRGKLDDVTRFRHNIVAFGKGSGASMKAFKSMDADAWITWPDWPAKYPEVLQQVDLSADRVIWRDLNFVTSPDADPEAREFLDFLVTEEAQILMATEGWVR